MEPSLSPIREHLERNKEDIGRPSISYFSSVEGRAIKNEVLGADYWVSTLYFQNWVSFY